MPPPPSPPAKPNGRRKKKNTTKKLHGMMKFSAIFAFKQRIRLSCGVQHKHLCFAFTGARVVFPSQHRSTPNYFHFEEYFTCSLFYFFRALHFFLSLCVSLSLPFSSCAAIRLLLLVAGYALVLHFFLCCTSTQKSLISFVKAQMVRFGNMCVCICVFLKSIAEVALPLRQCTCFP